MSIHDDPKMLFETPKELEAWFKKNHDTFETGVWIKLMKKGSTIKAIAYDEALDVALCYGWIDGIAKTVDANFYMVRFTPRGKKSIWSKRNTDIVARLIKEKKMHASGLAQIEAAKADGRWDAAYDSASNMEIPEDFMKEVSKNPKALAFFESLNKTNKYAIGWRLQTAKKPETRAARLKKLVEMMANGKKIH